MKATDLEASEVIKAFNRCLADVSKYQNALEKVCQPAGRITVKDNRYAVTVELRKIHSEEKEKGK